MGRPQKFPMKGAKARTVAAVLGLFTLAAVAGAHFSAAGLELHRAQAAEGPEGSNPRANFWRVVREGAIGTSTVQGQERGTLIQNGGQNWREIRNGLVANVSPYVLAAALLAIGLFYLLKGTDRLEEAPTGQVVGRWSLFERILHWYTAVLFFLMAITGFSIFFGRAVLIPVFGLSGFGGYAAVCKVLHNYCGPFFAGGVLLEIAAWVRFNLPRKGDLAWFRNLGGRAGGSGLHVARVNAGQKGWFWLVAAIGAGVGTTGVLLDFPLFGLTRLAMQISNVVHSILATIFLAAAFAHIYMGTLGTEGAFQGMWRGCVSTAFARQHHDLWYEELLRKGATEEKAS